MSHTLCARTSATEQAWDELHAALPPGWVIGSPSACRRMASHGAVCLALHTPGSAAGLIPAGIVRGIRGRRVDDVQARHVGQRIGHVSWNRVRLGRTSHTSARPPGRRTRPTSASPWAARPSDASIGCYDEVEGGVWERQRGNVADDEVRQLLNPAMARRACPRARSIMRESRSMPVTRRSASRASLMARWPGPHPTSRTRATADRRRWAVLVAYVGCASACARRASSARAGRS
jgi:hypothetical protein